MTEDQVVELGGNGTVSARLQPRRFTVYSVTDSDLELIKRDDNPVLTGAAGTCLGISATAFTALASANDDVWVGAFIAVGAVFLILSVPLGVLSYRTRNNRRETIKKLKEAED